MNTRQWLLSAARMALALYRNDAEQLSEAMQAIIELAEQLSE